MENLKKFTPQAVLAFFLATIAFLLWDFAPLQPAAFSPQAALPTNIPAFFAADSLPQTAESAQASTLAILPNGKLFAAWGTDAGILTSILGKSGWSAPQIAVNREILAGSVLAQVRKIGNPALLTQGGKLWLWFESHSWAGVQINFMQSENGETWSAPRRLVLSPFVNAGTRLGTAPAHLENGEIALPVSHEWLADFGEILRIDSNGKVLMKTRLPIFQTRRPALLVENKTTAHAFLRGAQNLQHAATTDGGTTWNALPPVDSFSDSVAALKLPSGAWLIVDENLNAWISKDLGKTWNLARVIESGAGGEFSYPFLMIEPNGRIHLSYTWNRKTIRHAAFSEAWLVEEIAENQK